MRHELSIYKMSSRSGYNHKITSSLLFLFFLLLPLLHLSTNPTLKTLSNLSVWHILARSTTTTFSTLFLYANWYFVFHHNSPHLHITILGSGNNKYHHIISYLSANFFLYCMCCRWTPVGGISENQSGALKVAGGSQ